MGKLLIVSTDAGVIQAMTGQFPADERRVETVADGSEAASLAKSLQPDRIVIDPGIGPEETRQIVVNVRRSIDYGGVVLVRVLDRDRTWSEVGELIRKRMRGR